jgi:hypothetical protein
MLATFAFSEAVLHLRLGTSAKEDTKGLSEPPPRSGCSLG